MSSVSTPRTDTRGRRRRPISKPLRALSTALVVLIPTIAIAGDIKGTVMEASGAGVRRRGEAKVTPGSKDVVVWITGSGASAVPAARLVLAQRNMEFSPSVLVVVAGQTVEMPNEDDLAHNVISSSNAKRFNLGIYPKGESKLVTFDQVGLVDVRCSLHKRMRASILVVPNLHFAMATAGGSYQITGIPAGRYTVKTWKPGTVETLQEIDVPDRGEVVRNVSIGAALAK
jgi:plastocyanin